MTGGQKILLSGVKPTGRPHIGNYFGAMKQFVELQDQHKALIFIADLHAITTNQEATSLRQDTLDLAIDYLAIGLDPAKTILFRQSDILEHANLNWIFNCLTTVPYLQRAHAYKDALAKNQEVNVGTFDYPILMAADILMYDADLVPVGQDQKQHVEYARDTAEKFNRVYGGATFKLPEPLIIEGLKTIPGIDSQKMSKSKGNIIPLFAEDAEIKTQVMKIVTDSKTPEEPKDPATCNVFALHELFSQDQLPELRQRYEQGGIGYKESKEILIANLIKFIAPLREKRQAIAADPNKVKAILKAGGDEARKLAQAKMAVVREKVGLNW